ncbi:unnamed protein product [Blepharisma stoltei]|uniref:F-box domain-containing protein n=1 Tax=Blepharisma stoltei TaxID=1481888 RepID=A0AAU9K7A6_9CILI|nr:unnamed protein product [Blepharisma stoltei]
MKSLNILSEIFSYLSYIDLSMCAKVSKLFNRVSKASSTWRREALRIATGNLIFYGRPLDQSGSSHFSIGSTDWKQNLLDFLNSKQNWLCIDFPNKSKDATNLFSEFINILKEPDIPFPVLRRDKKIYSTLFQEMLAYQESGPSLRLSTNALTESVIFELFKNHKNLEVEFATQVEISQLIIAKWNLRAKSEIVLRKMSIGALSSKSTAVSIDQESELMNIYFTFPLKNAKPVVLKLHRAIKCTISKYCQIALASILDYCDLAEQCNQYIIKWNAFCASMKELNAMYMSFNEAFNKVFKKKAEISPNGPQFSIMRLMALQWRRKVFDKFKDRLVEEALILIELSREKDMSQEFTYLLVKIVQSIVDMSINELSVHFINHSQFYSDGLYELLHEKIILETSKYYQNLVNLKPVEFLQKTNKDFKLIQRVFLKSTQNEIEKILTETKLEFCKKVSPEEAEKILYNESEVYPSRDNLEKKTSEDCMIEKHAHKAGFPLDSSPEERILYSMANDISPLEFEGIILNYELN